jgi:hypothetical protein
MVSAIIVVAGGYFGVWKIAVANTMQRNGYQKKTDCNNTTNEIKKKIDDVDKKVDRVSEDVGYIRGRLDK